MRERIISASRKWGGEGQMQSSLGWVDFSSEHRDRVRTVIDLLATPGVVDESAEGTDLQSREFTWRDNEK